MATKKNNQTYERRIWGLVGEDGEVSVGSDAVVLAEALALGLRPTGDATAKVIDEDGRKVIVWSVPVEDNI